MAAKRFKHLRDTFQKERKKVSASIPSSGAGVQDGDARFESTYTSVVDEADSCTNVLKRKAEMTQEDETMEDIVYVDNILPVSMQCVSSDENKSLLNKKSNMTSCATPSISTSSVPIIKVQAPKKMSTSQSEASLPEKSFTI
ncbi:uncharacterized protein LOC115237072 isoform X2 [Formica exsecta]|uniref:uncharacterized protein LOC115237072 isoform X2 n=1 Tax=Formica exsecta TaxID=72781 RepID=UPI001141FC59|nr:uncharacterized protein LOC115237072 isoform X2 [Formica exsecta]